MRDRFKITVEFIMSGEDLDESVELLREAIQEALSVEETIEEFDVIEYEPAELP